MSPRTKDESKDLYTAGSRHTNPAKFDAQLRGMLKGHGITKAIVVPGFLTDPLSKREKMMPDITNLLNDLNLDVTFMHGRVGFDSENSPTDNATAIAATLDDVGGVNDTLLVTHSKGSVDTLTCLVDHPYLRAKAKGWISIQGAVGGSPVADAIYHGLILADLALRGQGLPVSLNQALGVIFQLLFNGDRESLDCLRTHVRRDYLNDNKSEIRKIASEISIVAYGSNADFNLKINGGGSHLRRLTAPIFSAAQLTGGMIDNLSDINNLIKNGMVSLRSKNDGLVSIDASEIPHASLVQDEDGPDHAEAVMDVSAAPFNQTRSNGAGWDRKAMMRGLLNVLSKDL